MQHIIKLSLLSKLRLLVYSCQILFLACAAITPDFITFSTQERDFRRICLHLRKKSLTESVTDFFVVIDTNQHQDKKDPHWKILSNNCNIFYISCTVLVAIWPCLMACIYSEIKRKHQITFINFLRIGKECNENMNWGQA